MDNAVSKAEKETDEEEEVELKYSKGGVAEGGKRVVKVGGLSRRRR